MKTLAPALRARHIDPEQIETMIDRLMSFEGVDTAEWSVTKMDFYVEVAESVLLSEGDR